jgi:hypothetical protein
MYLYALAFYDYGIILTLLFTVRGNIQMKMILDESKRRKLDRPRLLDEK